MEAVLSIAGSDSSGGAGIQADIKTIAAHRLFAETAVTALTAQNTLGVTGVQEATPEFVRAQIDAVFADIRPDAVKVGMVSSAAIIEAIAEGLAAHGARHVVVDPVMVATSGARLIDEAAVGALVERLLPLAEVATPNIPEAEVLAGMAGAAGDSARPIRSEADMEEAALAIARACGSAILLKGGHRVNDANDVLATPEGAVTWLRGERVETENTHGTGCTLSSAIACNLAVGRDVVESVRRAKAYLTGALAHDLHLGRGHGPVNHMWEYE